MSFASLLIILLTHLSLTLSSIYFKLKSKYINYIYVFYFFIFPAYLLLTSVPPKKCIEYFSLPLSPSAGQREHHLFVIILSSSRHCVLCCPIVTRLSFKYHKPSSLPHLVSYHLFFSFVFFCYFVFFPFLSTPHQRFAQDVFLIFNTCKVQEQICCSSSLQTFVDDTLFLKFCFTRPIKTVVFLLIEFIY